MILGCATSRGYLVRDGSGYRDLYGRKAVYVGQEVSADRMPRCSLQVRLQPISLAPATQHSVSVTEALVQDLRNQLLRYRCKNLVRAYNSDFDASLLWPTRARSRTRSAHASSNRLSFNHNLFRCSRQLRTSAKRTSRPASRP